MLGNAANHGEHVADGGGFLSQLFDGLGVALHFTDQPMQTGEALPDNLLALFQCAIGIVAGAGGLAGIAGYLLDGGL